MKFCELPSDKQFRLRMNICYAFIDAYIFDADLCKDFSKSVKSYLIDIADTLDDEKISKLINSYFRDAINISKSFNDG